MTKVIAAGPSEHEKAIFPMFQVEGAEYIVASCTSLRENSVELSNGSTIEFDIAVVATGLNFPVFQASGDYPTVESRKQFIADYHNSIRNARSIIISGGGCVIIILKARAVCLYNQS